MPNEFKLRFLEALRARFGEVRKLEGSQSLFEVGTGSLRLYIRYSKVHDRNQAFYGLREKDLQQLEGHPSVICFLWDNQKEPLLIPFTHYEEILRTMTAAEDGQLKAMVYPQQVGCEPYLASVGRFNVEGYLGWRELESAIDASKRGGPIQLSHSQIQSMLGSLGAEKGYDVWLPANDRRKLDWSVTKEFTPHKVLPYSFKIVERVMEEIDVIWLRRGSAEPTALFEVEHSTPIYSGLLRFNDVHLVAPALKPRFNIVAQESRRPEFVRLLNRPTFQASGLREICTFLEYGHLASWHSRAFNAERPEEHEDQTEK